MNTSLGFIDVVALIGFWSIWRLIFITAQPLGALRKRIYDRWPPDGHWYVDADSMPTRRISRLERDVMANGFRVDEKIKRRPYLTTPETLHVPQMAAWRPDGTITMASVAVENLDGSVTETPTKEMRTVTIRVWMVRQGDGNKLTNAFTCTDCSPVWVYLAAVPAMIWARPFAVWVGLIGFAMLAAKSLAARSV